MAKSSKKKTEAKTVTVKCVTNYVRVDDGPARMEGDIVKDVDKSVADTLVASLQAEIV